MLWLVALMPLLPYDEYGLENECSTKNWVDRDKWEPISTLLDKTCSSNETVVLEIMKFWQEGLDCWVQILPGTSWCGNYPGNTYACIKNLTENLQPYLDSEEKFLADFMIQGHNLTMEALCKDGQAKLKEKLRKYGRTCERGLQPQTAILLRKCLPKIKFIEELEDVNAVLNKSDYCSNYHDAMECVIENMEKDCYKSVLNRSSLHLSVYKSILETFLESHMKFCTNTSNNSV